VLTRKAIKAEMKARTTATPYEQRHGDGSAAHSRRWRHSKPNLPSGTGFLAPETGAPKAPCSY
jgi:hypothetical protein